MKYYKMQGVVYAFESNGTQDEYITKGMKQMSPEDVDRHLNQDKYMTGAEKYQQYLMSLTHLDRRQFKLALLQKGVLKDLETALDVIPNEAEKMALQIEYNESAVFKRTSESVKTMFALINQTEEQINELWEKALAL